jgi:branched-chain amino acid transport system ATP-binding protein
MNAMLKEPILRVSNLSVSYSGVQALQAVNLRVEPGKIVALVGGNGNGKSTTLRAVAGLNAVDAGDIHFEGKPVKALPAHKRVPLGLSLVPEGRRLFPRLTVLRNLELGAYTRDDQDEVREGIERMLTLFPILKERSDQLAGTMSGGEQQMLAIARGLMARPKLLMLDEPSWGIAPKFVSKVLDVIQRVNETGVSVLLVEQNLHKALSIAHHAYVIQTGRIVLEGAGQDLLHNEDVKKAYLGL